MHVTTRGNQFLRLSVTLPAKDSKFAARFFLICFYYNHKKRKGSLETLTVLLIFLLELEISGGIVQEKQQKMAAFKKDFLNRYNFETVLAIFCSHDYGVNASEAVEKIATDEKTNATDEKTNIGNAPCAAHSHTRTPPT